MSRWRKWILLGMVVLVGLAAGVLGWLNGTGFFDHVPYAARSPIVYPQSQNIQVTHVLFDPKLSYNAMSFDTFDEPAKVVAFYKKALEADGWYGDSDTGGPEHLLLMRCHPAPGCNERYEFHLDTTRPGATHVDITLYLYPFPP